MSNLQNQECDMDLICLSFSITPLNFFNILMFHLFHRHEMFISLPTFYLAGRAQLSVFHFKSASNCSTSFPWQLTKASQHVVKLRTSTERRIRSIPNTCIARNQESFDLSLIANYSSWYKEKPVVEWWIFWKERAKPPNFVFERLLESGVGCARFSQL